MKKPVRRGWGPASPIAALLATTVLVAACGGASPPATVSTPATAPATTAASSPGATAPTASPGGGAGPGAGVGTPVDLAAASAPPVACDALVKTPAQTEGPYFTAGSPERSDLREPGMAGTTLVVVGHVVDEACKPIAGAVIDVWQADSTGAYDNSGYRLRGHLESAADGSYRFTTIVPGLYPGRTEHVHVKVTPPGGSTLTTQLYFPGVTRNEEDGIYDPATLLTITPAPDGLLGVYTFVV